MAVIGKEFIKFLAGST